MLGWLRLLPAISCTTCTSVVAVVIPVVEVLVTGGALDAKWPSAHPAWDDESPHDVFLLSGEHSSDVDGSHGG